MQVMIDHPFFYDNQVFFLQLHTYKYIAELCTIYGILFIWVNQSCISSFEQAP